MKTIDVTKYDCDYLQETYSVLMWRLDASHSLTLHETKLKVSSHSSFGIGTNSCITLCILVVLR